jgi:RNA polymerase sigma-70 factor, ECF subfamily
MTDSDIGSPNSAAVPEAIVAQVRARWEKLPLKCEAFASYATDRGVVLDRLSSEIGADLYLAFACYERLPGAIQCFHQAYALKIRGIGRNFGNSECFADEVLQRVSEKLFVASGTQPGIVQYRADAPLSAWINTVARRLALRQAKSAHPERFLDEDVLANEIAETCDQELSLLREQHREIVRAALASALRQMPKREQRFLQLNLVAGISMDRIGKIYGLSQSSVSRKIQRAIRNVICSAKEEVREKLRVSSEEIESIFKLIQSCIDLTLSQFDLEPHALLKLDADASTELPRIEA